MEAKAKSGAPPVPKPPSKASEKKEPTAPPRKADPAPADPAPIAPATENPPPPQDGVAEQEAGPEGGEEAAANTDTLEALKPFLIGGAVIAAGAILLGVLLLARRN